MTIETLKKKLAEVLEMHEFTVGRRGDCCRICINLRHKGRVIGFYPLNYSYDQIDLKAIAAQCAEDEAKNIADGVYILQGTPIIIPNAFQYYNMADITIPGSVNTIKEFAFYSCRDLKKVTINEGVASIERLTFTSCSSLESLHLADSIKEIGDDAFSYCPNLTEVTLPKHLKRISKKLFNACYQLKSVTIPKGVRHIDDCAFKQCRSLENLEIPQGVLSIGEEAFYECNSLTSVIIPSSVRSIGANAFADCESLKQITVLSKNIEIDVRAFSGCPVLEEVTFPKDMQRFKEISDGLFNGNKAMKEFVIPSTVEKIGENAFEECNSLNGIELPDGLTSIGEDAFWGCSLIKNIAIPSTVTYIGANAFNRTSIPTPIICNKVLNYVPVSLSGKFIVEDGIERIDDYVFQETDLTDIILPESVKEIGESAFSECHKLQNVNIPSQVKRIKESTFDNCTSLNSITLPDGLESIEFMAFSNCPIQRMIIPGTVNKIGYMAFGGCKSLAELTFVNYISVYNIDFSAFNGCTALYSVNLPSGLTWSKLKDRFYDSPWGKNKPVKISAAMAKRMKLEELENASYKAIIDAALAPHRGRVTVENKSIQVMAELPGKSYIVAKFELTDDHGCKIPVTEFKCDQLKQLAANAKPNTTYWLYPEGTVLKRYTTFPTMTFTGVTENMVLMPGITSLDDKAFEGYKGLRHVVFPDTLVSIGKECFVNTDLEEPVIFEDTLCCAPIGSSASSYTIPDKVKYIAPYAFKGYRNLEEVIFPASVRVVDGYVFDYCPSLHRVVFAAPVKMESVMKGLLEKFQYKDNEEEGYTIIDHMSFYDCDEITDFVVPNPAALLGSIISSVYN